MGAPTSIAVTVDQTEYSRYELAYNTITATVIVSGGTPYTNELIRVELVKARRERDAVVATNTITLNGSTTTATTTFYLPDLVDQDMIHLARHGRYLVRAYSVTNNLVTDDSSDFDIRIVTIDRLKKDYLFGIELKATELRWPKFQPVSLPGVTITEVSSGHPFGFYQLTYNYHVDGATTVRLLSWAGGPTVPIAAAGTYILKAGVAGPASSLLSSNNKDYIVVKVASLALLPTANVTEEIFIDKKVLDDASLGRYLAEASAWVENEVLMAYVEPTNVVSDVDPTTVQFAAGVNGSSPLFEDTDFDFLASPLTYFVPRSAGAWVTIQSPFLQLLRVDNLFGAIAGTRVIDIDLDWIEISQQGGLIQLVPYNQEIAFDFIGLIWVNAIRGATELPNFWHYNVIAGLRDCPPEIQELIAKKAAVDALVAAGLALRPGIGSLSLGRDGVSESVSYTTGSQYGIFTGTIMAYKDWINQELQKFRAKYRGVMLTVV